MHGDAADPAAGFVSAEFGFDVALERLARGFAAGRRDRRCRGRLRWTDCWSSGSSFHYSRQRACLADVQVAVDAVRGDVLTGLDPEALLVEGDVDAVGLERN